MVFEDILKVFGRIFSIGSSEEKKYQRNKRGEKEIELKAHMLPEDFKLYEKLKSDVLSCKIVIGFLVVSLAITFYIFWKSGRGYNGFYISLAVIGLIILFLFMKLIIANSKLKELKQLVEYKLRTKTRKYYEKEWKEQYKDIRVKKDINVKRGKIEGNYEYCPECGGKNLIGSKFCSECGKRL